MTAPPPTASASPSYWWDQATLSAHGTAPVTVLAADSAVTRLRLYVRSSALWGVGHPQLYRAVVIARRGDAVIDETSIVFGIRRLQLDPIHGLRLNREVVTLRGACIHHDNGILGAATIGRADERRIELLKAAGFNAIRSAHYPASSSLLDACDRIVLTVSADGLSPVESENGCRISAGGYLDVRHRSGRG